MAEKKMNKHGFRWGTRVSEMSEEELANFRKFWKNYKPKSKREPRSSPPSGREGVGGPRKGRPPGGIELREKGQLRRALGATTYLLLVRVETELRKRIVNSGGQIGNLELLTQLLINDLREGAGAQPK